MNPYRDNHPVMLVSKSAYILALKVAAKGGNVVFKCHTVNAFNDARKEVISMMRWRCIFSYWLFSMWTVSAVWMRHGSGGHIHFIGYDSIDVCGRRVDLEVRA